MKKLIALTIVAVSLAFHVRAQEVVYDPIMNIEQILDETENLAKYAIMIENEEQQLTQLKDQLTEFKNFESQFGTPSSVTVSTGTSLSSDLQTSEPVQSLENIVSRADGTTALTSNDNGLYNTVGTSFQTPGGQTIERPADQYKKYAAVSDAANNFVTVADDTAQRRSTIKNEIAQTTEQLQSASSDAEVQKLHAVLTGLNTDLANTDDELNQAADSAIVQDIQNRNDQQKQQQALTEQQNAEFSESVSNYTAKFQLLAGPTQFPTQ